MGKIKKILENELIGGTQTTDVYPVTSIKAVYDENNERLDNILNRRGVVNISTNYNNDHIAEVLTLEQAIAKVPSSDKVLGFQGKFLTSEGWKSYIFTGDSVSSWYDISKWIELISSAVLAQELGDSTSKAISQKAVTNEIKYISSTNSADKFIKECYIYNPNNIPLYLGLVRRISETYLLFSIKDKNTKENYIVFNKTINPTDKYFEITYNDVYGYFILNLDAIGIGEEKTFNADFYDKSYNKENAPNINTYIIQKQIEENINEISSDYIEGGKLPGFFHSLYLTGIDDVSNIVLTRIYNNSEISGYYYGFYFYDKNMSTPYCRYLSKEKPKINEIITIKEYQNSGVKGYAVVDFDKISEGYDSGRYSLEDNCIKPNISVSLDDKINYKKIIANNYSLENFLTDGEEEFDNITISTQEEFSSLSDTLKTAISNNYKSISVNISNGIFKFKENHLNFQDLVAENDVKISICGSDKTYIISDGEEIDISEKTSETLTHNIFDYANYTGDEIFLDENLNIIQKSNTNSFGLIYANSEITKVDENEKIAKFKLPDDFNIIDGTFTKAFVLFTSWFVSNYCEITKIENNEVYFKVNSEQNWNNFDSHINGNYTNYGVYPMFELYNINLQIDKIFIKDNKLYVPKNIQKIYICKYKTFINSSSSNISLFVNLNFKGSALGNNIGLINLNNANNIYIKSNFENIGSFCIHSICDYLDNVLKSENINIENCKVKNIFNRFAYIKGKNVTIKNNYICNNNTIYLNGAIKVTGTNYAISNNKIINSPYHCISIGISRDEKWEVSGCVEYNVCYNDDNFISTNRILSDFGLISFFTKNDNSICRYNVCYNSYSPIGEARGIFGDDGCRGLTLKGNLTFMNKTYGIDVRYVNDSEGLSNSGNIAENNIVTDKFRFQGKSTENAEYVKPIFKNNIYNELIYSDIDIQETNTLVQFYSYNNKVYTKSKISNIPFINTLPTNIIKYIIESS